MDIITSVQLADMFATDTTKRHGDPDAYRGYGFPSPWFQKATGGFGRDWLTFIYGQPGDGKSAFLNTAVIDFGRKNRNFLYVSLEESLITLGRKAISLMANIDKTKFRDITVQPTDWSDIRRVTKELRDFPGYWAYGISKWDELGRSIQKLDPLPDIVMIDYLQLMEDPQNSPTMNVVVGKASAYLARLSKGLIKNQDGSDHIISVICAAQLNDDRQVLHSRDPDRHADLVIEVKKVENGNGGFLPDCRDIIIRKAKHGVVGHTRMGFFGSRSLFGDLQQSASRKPMTLPNLNP